MRFEVDDATDLTRFDRFFDTVVDSALYHCLNTAERHTYAAALHRVTTPRARWFIYCFSEDNVNGVTAPMEAVAPAEIRDTLASTGWLIDFLGPATFVCDAAGFSGSFGKLPESLWNICHPDSPGRCAKWANEWRPSCRSSMTAA